jgi:hypothetical protein
LFHSEQGSSLQAKTEIGSGGSTRSFASHVMVADFPLGNVAYSLGSTSITLPEHYMTAFPPRWSQLQKTPTRNLAACTQRRESRLRRPYRQWSRLGHASSPAAPGMNRRRPWTSTAPSPPARRSFDRPAVLRLPSRRASSAVVSPVRWPRSVAITLCSRRGGNCTLLIELSQRNTYALLEMAWEAHSCSPVPPRQTT